MENIDFNDFNYEINNHINEKIYVSLGNYCLTSSLLKENNLKYCIFSI